VRFFSGNSGAKRIAKAMPQSSLCCSMDENADADQLIHVK